MSYICWVSALETLEFAGSESNCHPLYSCAIAGWQKDADMARILIKVLKRFGRRRLQGNVVRLCLGAYNIYNIHERYPRYRGNLKFSRGAEQCSLDIPR
jgi:hypothetical protein